MGYMAAILTNGARMGITALLEKLTMIKILIGIGSLVPTAYTIIETAEQAWASATTVEEKLKVIASGLEDLLSAVRGAL